MNPATNYPNAKLAFEDAYVVEPGEHIIVWDNHEELWDLLAGEFETLEVINDES